MLFMKGKINFKHNIKKNHKLVMNDIKCSKYLLKKQFQENVKEELMKTCFHPRNVEKFEGWGFYDD
jgi:hypothetical protein